MCENGQEVEAHRSNGLSTVQTEKTIIKAQQSAFSVVTMQSDSLHDFATVDD